MRSEPGNNGKVNPRRSAFSPVPPRAIEAISGFAAESMRASARSNFRNARDRDMKPGRGALR